MNREEEAIDLSPLAPDDQSERWAEILTATKLRVDQALMQRRPDPLTLIASWMKPVLTTAGVALALLVPFEIHLELSEARADQVDRLVTLSTGALHPVEPATAADFLDALTADQLPTP